jgi:hypothetical protein
MHLTINVNEMLNIWDYIDEVKLTHPPLSHVVKMLNELDCIGLRYHDTKVAGRNFYLLNIFLSFIMIVIPIHALFIIKFLALKKTRNFSLQL